jgi:hypothetical protein
MWYGVLPWVLRSPKYCKHNYSLRRARQAQDVIITDNVPVTGWRRSFSCHGHLTLNFKFGYQTAEGHIHLHAYIGILKLPLVTQLCTTSVRCYLSMPGLYTHNFDNTSFKGTATINTG